MWMNENIQAKGGAKARRDDERCAGRGREEESEVIYKLHVPYMCINMRFLGRTNVLENLKLGHEFIEPY